AASSGFGSGLTPNMTESLANELSSESSVPDQPAPPSANAMKSKNSTVNEVRAEYDFSKGVRGKYHKRLLKGGSNVVVLEPDVAKAFPDSAAVNEALRVVIKARQ